MEGQAIAFANVQLKQANKLIAFQNTNDLGQFSFEPTKPGEYSLSVTYLGYERQNKTITLLAESPLLEINFSLEPSVVLLDKVVVIEQKLLAKATKDTISYNIDVVADGTENNLGELLGKLPGLEVDENGKVKAKGKQVDHLLINGKKFFGEQHQMATKNLSADMVAKVDLINRYKDTDNMSLTDTEDTALNIQLKKEYNGKITGDFSALGGIKKRWLGHSNLFLFKNNLSLSWVNDANNLGEEALSLQDYIALKGGIDAFQGNSGSGASVIDDELPEFVLTGNKTFNKRENRFSAVNLSYSPSNRFRLTSYALYSNNEQSKTERSEQQLILPTNGSTLLKTENQKLNLGILDAHLKVNYNFDETSLLTYQINVQDNRDDINREIDIAAVTDNSTDERYDNNGFQVNQELSWFKQKKLLWNFAIRHQFKNKTDQYALAASLPLFEGVLDDRFFEQEKKFEQQQLSFSGGFDKRLKAGIFSAYVNSVYDDRKIENNLVYRLTEQGQVGSRNWKNTAGLGFQDNTGKFKYDLGLSVNWIRQDFEERRNLDFYLSPVVYGKWELSNTQYFSVKYAYEQSYATADHLNSFRSIQDYRNLLLPSKAVWDLPLPEHNFDFQYFNFDLFGGRLSVFNVHYSINRQAIQKNVSTNLLFDQYNFLNVRSNSNFTAVLFFSQKFNFVPLTAAIKATYTAIDYLSFVNDFENRVRSEKYFIDFNISSYFKSSPINFKTGIIIDRNQSLFKDFDIKNGFTSWQPYAEVRISNNSKSMILLLNASYLLDDTQLAQSNQMVFSPEFRLRLNPHFTLSLLGENVFFIDAKARVRSIATESLIDNITYLPLAGYVGLKLKYTIRGVAKKEKKKEEKLKED